jgi:hypothetical protein
VECDDEYWEAENPADAFKQPPGKPSYAAAFTYTLKLMEIIGFMSRTLYSTKKSRILSGVVGEEWEQRVVTELDSSLNKWKDSLPAHRESYSVSIIPLAPLFSIGRRSDRKHLVRQLSGTPQSPIRSFSIKRSSSTRRSSSFKSKHTGLSSARTVHYRYRPALSAPMRRERVPMPLKVA